MSQMHFPAIKIEKDGHYSDSSYVHAALVNNEYIYTFYLFTENQFSMLMSSLCSELRSVGHSCRCYESRFRIYQTFTS